MADKEPRRRKKNRRDSQKKDDVRPEEVFFPSSLKVESRDSDQDAEEEIVSHSHHSQPSNVSKFVFIILFSGLVVSLSFIFISLREADKGPVDIFDMGHDDHHTEAAHDDHLEGALHDEHDEHDDHHDDHEVSLDDFIPGFSSMFSLSSPPAQEVEEPDIPAAKEDDDDNDDNDDENDNVEPESSTDQGILEEYIADSTPSSTEEPPPEVYPETTTSYPTYDYSEPEDFSASPVYEPTPEPYRYDEPSPVSTDAYEYDEQDDFSMYERADITNEADYEMRDQLDEVDDMVEKDSDNGDDEDDEGGVDDDEEEEEDEGVGEEYDFWQF